MYTLYFLPGTCSLAVHTVIYELNQEVTLLAKMSAQNYSEINPVGSVPVLQDGSHIVREGAAIMLYLMEKHLSPMLPATGMARSEAIQNLMFANATMHPAYGHLFFVNSVLSEGDAKEQVMTAAAENITRLWRVVEDKLQDRNFLGGTRVSVADIMLTVYARWSGMFDVAIAFGPNTRAMFDRVEHLPSFQRALQVEAAKQVA